MNRICVLFGLPSPFAHGPRTRWFYALQNGKSEQREIDEALEATSTVYGPFPAQLNAEQHLSANHERPANLMVIQTTTAPMFLRLASRAVMTTRNSHDGWSKRWPGRERRAR